MRLIDRIQKNHENFVTGKINYLPFGNLGKFTEWFPGIMRGEMTGITGTPASSKTSVIKHFIIHQGIPWAINNNKNFKILYFGMEESKIQFQYSLLSYQAFIKHQLQYNIKDFESIGRTIDIKDLSLLENAYKRVEKMLQYIVYIDNTYNSYGIWKKTRDFAEERGTFYLKEKVVKFVGEDNTWDTYVPNDPEEFVVLVIDHLLLISPQKNERDQAEAMWNTVENLRRYAAVKLNYSVICIHHQNADSENQDSRRANTILPTENGLARNKEIARSYFNLIGIANPNKINTAGTQPILRIWDGHNLEYFNNYLRTFNILKSRFGESAVHDTVFFAGRTGYFKTLPKINTPEYNNFLKTLKTFK